MLALLNHIKRHEMTSSSCEFGWKIDNKHTSNSTARQVRTACGSGRATHSQRLARYRRRF